MSDADFLALKSFLKVFISKQDVKRLFRSRIALVSYSDSGVLEFGLLEFSAALSWYGRLFDLIDSINRHSGTGNNIGNALQQCHLAFSVQGADRVIYPNVIFVIADRQSDNPQDTQTQAAYEKNQDQAFIVTLGVGNSINTAELAQMSSTLYTQNSVTQATYYASSYATGVFDVNLVNALVRAACVPPPSKQCKILELLPDNLIYFDYN